MEILPYEHSNKILSIYITFSLFKIIQSVTFLDKSNHLSLGPFLKNTMSNKNVILQFSLWYFVNGEKVDSLGTSKILGKEIRGVTLLLP